MTPILPRFRQLVGSAFLGTSARAERMNSDPKFAQSADVVADQAVLLLVG